MKRSGLKVLFRIDVGRVGRCRGQGKCMGMSMGLGMGLGPCMGMGMGVSLDKGMGHEGLQSLCRPPSTQATK